MSLLLQLTSTYTGTVEATELTDVIEASGSFAVVSAETSQGGGAAPTKKQMKRVYVDPYIKVDPYRGKPLSVTISGSVSVVESADSLVSFGRHTPPKVTGVANVFTSSPLIMAKGSMNTDRIDSELATALLYL